MMQSSTTPLEVTYLRTTSLKPDPRNPRVHSDKQVRQIAQSIESFGFNVPLLIDDEQKVIAGHGRLLAARKLGWDTVPAIRLSHLTESQRMAFLIADNRLTENSSWDERMLGEQLKILSELELDFDLEAIGFEVPEIDLLIDGLNTVPEADPDDRLPEISESAVTVSGDLWQLGKHRVLCGNSLVTAGYERLMDGAKADLVITDPPYNVVIDGHATGNGSIHHREFAMASGEMSSTEFTDFLRKAMLAVRDHSATGSLAYYFMDWRHMTEILSAGQEVYTELLNLCVWAKSNGGMGSFYRSAHLVFLFKNGTGSHRNNV
jgi:ParB-like nuclease domain/DNA methylase